MRFDGKGVYIRPLSLADSQDLLDLRIKNREFLEPLEPARNDRFFTLEVQRELIELATKDWEIDRAFAFGIFDRSSNEMIGRVALSNVVRSAWQNATLGYFVAESHTGRGVASEAVHLCVDFAFKHARLHRVQAGTMVDNDASAAVLRKNGFRFEGLSPRYLKINGQWEDHHLYAITAEDWL